MGKGIPHRIDRRCGAVKGLGPGPIEGYRLVLSIRRISGSASYITDGRTNRERGHN